LAVKYAVLGSNSFAGGHFVAHALQTGAEVVGLNRSPEGPAAFLPYRRLNAGPRYAFHQIDINRDFDRLTSVLDQARPAIVVDFAGQGMVAESWVRPEQWYTTNIVAKVRLHDWLRTRDWLERYVRISTPEVYGSHEGLLAETWDCNPTTPYAVSHAAIDLSLRAFHRHYGFPVVFTRFANFFGPSQQLYRLVPRAVLSALTGRKLPLHGGGKSVRAFIYGEDVARAVMAAAHQGVAGEVYHFSPTRFLNIREAVEIICQRLDVPFDAVAEPTPDRPAKDYAYLMDSTKARRTLGWSDAVTFEDGVDMTIQWAQANLRELSSLPWDYVHKV
jgi:dTDP-glucose 4,6-dehydratase